MSLAINTTAAISGSDIGLSFGGAGFLIFYYLGKLTAVHPAANELKPPKQMHQQQQM